MDCINTAIELTRTLVRLPSESSGATATDRQAPEAGVLEYLLSFCRRQGLNAGTQPVTGGRRNLWVRLPRPGAPAIVLAAHMDTVSGAGMESPFSGDLRDDRIHGRGACDDKGPLAVALSVLASLRRRSCPWDITFVGTVDEECTMAGAAAAAVDLPTFALGIGLEPTELQVVVAHKGVLRVEVATRGRAVHSSIPELGSNAINAMLPVLADLEAFAESLGAGRDDPLLGRPTLAVTGISGGKAANIIPDRCSATLDIRILPEMDQETVLAEISRVLAGRADMRVCFAARGIRTDASLAPVTRLLDAVSAEQGQGPAAVGGASYATDCSQLVTRGPCVVWGPGSISQAHKRQEWISTDQIARACRILTRFLTGAE